MTYADIKNSISCSQVDRKYGLLEVKQKELLVTRKLVFQYLFQTQFSNGLQIYFKIDFNSYFYSQPLYFKKTSCSTSTITDNVDLFNLPSIMLKQSK